MKNETRIGPQFTNSKQAASGKKCVFLQQCWNLLGSFKYLLFRSTYVCVVMSIHLSKRSVRKKVHKSTSCVKCFAVTLKHILIWQASLIQHWLLLPFKLIWAREVTLLYRLAWKCALYPLPAKKVYRTYCIPLCSWNQEEEGILAEQLLLGFVGLEGIRESLMEAADPGPAEQERENQTWNFF